MPKEREEGTPGRLRALVGWLRGGTPAPSPPGRVRLREGLPARVGHYAIERKLGQGGMGVVYAARDERLERSVALKAMTFLAGDETARKRFWREARLAASVNHPNVCQIYEIAEDEGELFITMELLQGQPLSERVRQGPLNVSEMLPIALEMLAALQALHSRGVVHRDLKPSNVFLTPHGVKLLDFGLARTWDQDRARPAEAFTALTQTGMVMGTPGYMAPEQVTEEGLDARSDLFAAGALIFEMLAGRPAFTRRTVVETLHATLSEQPPALSGSPQVAAVDRVIRRALAKRPADRPASAEAMAEELRAVRAPSETERAVLARPLTRIVVLPFRMLRPDPETDFLAFSLADAITTSLQGIRSLVVRSSAVAARFGSEAPDLKALAVEADVDRVVMGTLLRSADQLRATAQLVETPAGTVLASHTVQSSLGNLFQLQDDIARGVVEALALPLGVDDTPTPQAPHNARAYALYLQGNELARNYDDLPKAAEMYECCLELDSSFAPAWAQLGRCQRVIGKFIDQTGESAKRAESALRRALELEPRLAVAHRFYASLEADTGQAQAAVVRLLSQAARHGNDPELFAGLVHACRYCGLFEQSIAAHDEARRLDPNVPTSLDQTILMTGDIERLLASKRSRTGVGGDEMIRVIGLGLAGRREEARHMLTDLVDGRLAERASRIPAFRSWTGALMAWLEGRPADMVARVEELGALKILDDPEAIFQMGWLLCDVGEGEQGLATLRRAVTSGYFVAPTLAGSRSFDSLREQPDFKELLAEAEAGRKRALDAFEEAGGRRLLGQ